MTDEGSSPLALRGGIRRTVPQIETDQYVGFETGSNLLQLGPGFLRFTLFDDRVPYVLVEGAKQMVSTVPVVVLKNHLKFQFVEIGEIR